MNFNDKEFFKIETSSSYLNNIGVLQLYIRPLNLNLFELYSFKCKLF